MADEPSKDDKTEQATPKRLEKAKEEGQIARSKELTTFLMVLGGSASLWMTGSFMAERLGKVVYNAMHFNRERALDSAVAGQYIVDQAREALIAVMPLMAVMFVIALVAPAILGGWIFATKSFMPNFGKLNPLAGLKKIFSVGSLTELLKSVAKAGLVGLVATLFLKANLHEFFALGHMSIQAGIAECLKLVQYCCAFIVLSLIVVVGIDVPYQLVSFSNKMKMTKEEIKREHKESEGDPHVKAKIRAQQQALSRSRMMSSVPTANVIITNPTHYAVALAYSDGESGAPRVVAKGVDAVALRIREVGKENNVPILEAPALARALYWNVDLEREIPAVLYKAVAEVLAWVFKLHLATRGEIPRPDQPENLVVPEGMDQARLKNKRK